MRQQPGSDRGHGEPTTHDVRGRDMRRLPGRPAEQDVPAGDSQQFHRSVSGLSADAVEDDADLAVAEPLPAPDRPNPTPGSRRRRPRPFHERVRPFRARPLRPPPRRRRSGPLARTSFPGLRRMPSPGRRRLRSARRPRGSRPRCDPCRSSRQQHRTRRGRAARATRSPARPPPRHTLRSLARGARRRAGRSTRRRHRARRRRPRRPPRDPGISGRSGSGTGPICIPLRSVVSIRCTPLACTAMRTWSSAGSGSGTSSYCRFSGGPKAWRRIACTLSPRCARPARRSRRCRAPTTRSDAGGCECEVGHRRRPRHRGSRPRAAATGRRWRGRR